MRFFFGRSRERHAQLLGKVVEQIDKSFCPKPTLMSSPDRVPRSIDGFRDPRLKQRLEKAKLVELEGPMFTLVLMTERRIAAGLFLRKSFLQGVDPHDIQSLFAAIVDIQQPFVAYCDFTEVEASLAAERGYMQSNTVYDIGLLWLKFFGPKITGYLGREALLDNPHGVAKRVGDGVLIQVGQSPWEGLTKAGKSRLLQATLAMPRLATSIPPEASQLPPAVV